MRMKNIRKILELLALVLKIVKRLLDLLDH